MLFVILVENGPSEFRLARNLEEAIRAWEWDFDPFKDGQSCPGHPYWKEVRAATKEEVCFYNSGYKYNEIPRGN